MDKSSIQLISIINFWKGKIDISSIKGGITNKNFLISFEKKLSSELLINYKAIKSAFLLRETMWSMISEITSNIEFDYKS